jgi:hypothetical protein
VAIDGTDLEAELDAVFAATPETFTVARDALVKKLKAEKRKGDAATVAAFRRPTAILWGMNQVARADGAPIAELRRLGQVALHAQEQLLSGGSPADVLAAVEQRRAMVSALVNSVVMFLTEHGVAADALAPQLRSAFEMVSVNTAAGAALQRGRLAAIPTEADGTSGADDSTTAKAPRHLSVVRETPASAEASTVSADTSVSEPVDELAGVAEPEPAEQPTADAAMSEDAKTKLEAEQQTAAEEPARREAEARDAETSEGEAEAEAERAEAEQRVSEQRELEQRELEQRELEQRELERVAMWEAAERAVNVSTEAIAEASKQVSELSVAAIEAATNEQAIQAELSALTAEIATLHSRLAEKASEANRAAERTKDAASQRAGAEQALSVAIREASRAKEALATLQSETPGAVI